jgi:hypothetical protein
MAAYAVALQISLSGLVAISWLQSLANAPDAAICSEHLSGTGQAPHDHAICPCGPACTMSGCAVVIGAGATPVTIAWPTGLPWLAPARPYLRQGATEPSRKTPHAPRAPPADASAA